MHEEWFRTNMDIICLVCKKTSTKPRKGYKFCSVTCSNRYNKNNLQKIIAPQKSELLAEFIGICLGDGCASNYQVSITLNSHADKEYLPYVVGLTQQLFPTVKVTSVIRKDNATDVRLYSKEVVAFLQACGIISNKKTVPKWILKNANYMKACFRGLFDTEGSISYKVYTSKGGVSLYKQLNFRNTNMHLIKFMRDGLVRLGFSPTMTLKKSIYLSNHKDIDTLRTTIGFSNPKLYKRSKIYTHEEFLKLKENIVT